MHVVDEHNEVAQFSTAMNYRVRPKTIVSVIAAPCCYAKLSHQRCRVYSRSSVRRVIMQFHAGNWFESNTMLEALLITTPCYPFLLCDSELARLATTAR